LGLSRNQVSRIARRLGIRRAPVRSTTALEAAVKAIEAGGRDPHCVSTGGAAALPVEEPISAAPDAPLAGDALSVTAQTPSAESADV